MDKKNKETTETNFDDFFVNFIAKRRKNYLKKGEKIDLLSKKNKSELTPEQLELVENKDKNNERIAYFNGIIDLYLLAIKQKKPELLQSGNISNAKTEEDILNLYFLGNCMRNCKDKCMAVIEKKKLEVSFQENLHQNFSKVFNNDCYSITSRNHNLESLRTYLSNTELKNQVNSIVNDPNCFPEKTEKVVEVQQPEKEEEVQQNKPQFFMSSDEEENNEEEAYFEEDRNTKTKAHANVVPENTQEEEDKGIDFVPFSSSDDEDGFERKNQKKNKNSIRGRGARGYKRREGDNNFVDESGERGRGFRGRGRGRGGYRGRGGERGRGYRGGRGRGEFRGNRGFNRDRDNFENENTGDNDYTKVEKNEN